jgi:hypothetical protein
MGIAMFDYKSVIRQELFANSKGKQSAYKRDFSNYTSSSSDAWDDALDVVQESYEELEDSFWSSSEEEDDDMQCSFF